MTINEVWNSPTALELNPINRNMYVFNFDSNNSSNIQTMAAKPVTDFGYVKAVNFC
jgi:hypothetical protein